MPPYRRILVPSGRLSVPSDGVVPSGFTGAFGSVGGSVVGGVSSPGEVTGALGSNGGEIPGSVGVVGLFGSTGVSALGSVPDGTVGSAGVLGSVFGIMGLTVESPGTPGSAVDSTGVVGSGTGVISVADADAANVEAAKTRTVNRRAARCSNLLHFDRFILINSLSCLKSGVRAPKGNRRIFLTIISQTDLKIQLVNRRPVRKESRRGGGQTGCAQAVSRFIQ